MKTYTYAYTLPEFEGCTPKQRFHRHDIWRGMLDVRSIAEVEAWITDKHPGRRVSVRYIAEVTPDDARKFHPAFLDINNHLWREIGLALGEI